MPDFAVSAAIKAIDKLSTVFHSMSKSVGDFGSKGEQSIDRVNKKASLFKTILGGVISGNLITMGIQKIGRGLKEMVEALPEFAERGEQIERTAKMLGLSADAYQRLAYAAKLTDTPTEAFDASMRKLNLAIGQGERGMGPLIKQMTRLSPQLAMQLRTARNADEAFMDVADAVSKTTNAQARAAIVVAAFGKAGQQMLPMLLQGRAGLMKLRQEADIYGKVLDDNTLAASGRFHESIKRISGILLRLKDEVLSRLIEKVTPLIGKFIAWYTANKDIINQRIDEIFTKIGNAIQTVVDTWNSLNNLAGGHLVRDILLIAGAWKAVQVAIIAARTAQVAFSMISGAAGAAGAGGGVAALGIGAAGLAPALGGLAILAAVYYGASQYAKNPGAANLNPNMGLLSSAAQSRIAAGGASAYMTGMMTPALAAALNKQTNVNVTVPVNVDNRNAPGVNSSVRTSPPVTGNPGYQYAGAQ